MNYFVVYKLFNKNKAAICTNMKRHIRLFCHDDQKKNFIFV